MRFQNYLVPQMRDMHRFHLDGPEECTPILMQSFATQALAGMFNVPDYSNWLSTASHTATYRYHRQALQALQWKYPGQRWLLKSPDHIAAIGSILETYPDACLVHMHRDPVKSVSSWASLNQAFRGIYMKSVDPKDVGIQVLNRLSSDMRDYLEQRKKCNPERFFDLQYSDLVKDPLASLQRIYRHFSLVLGDDALVRMEKYLAEERQSKTLHRYTPHDFGLSVLQIRQSFGMYIDTFSIPPENSSKP